MSSMVKGTQQRQLDFGYQVTKAAATIPQTASQTLFTVSGGSVFVTMLVGQVTTVIGGTVTTLSLGTVPTVGSAAVAGISTATAITSKEVGTFVSAVGSGGIAGALAVGANAGGAVYPVTFIVPAGTITCTTSASTTGALKWYISYIPLDPGASVA